MLLMTMLLPLMGMVLTMLLVFSMFFLMMLTLRLMPPWTQGCRQLRRLIELRP